MRKFEGFQKGVNLGGWISQFSEYDTEHFETFITEKDIEYIASLGFDHVRVPVDYNVLETEDGTPIERGFGYLKSCLKWCRKNNLHMLIDLHECFGYSFDPLKKDMDRKKFFYDEELQERFLKLWRRIAEIFADSQDCVAFEPLNEVVLPEVADAWNRVVNKYITMMREILPDAWLVIGGVNYNSVLSVPMLDPPYDERIVFNFHCYDPHIFTHQGAYWMPAFPSDYRIRYPQPLEVYQAENEKIFGDREGSLFVKDIKEIGPDFFEKIFAPALEAAEKYDVPLYCGEYGVIDLADNASKLRWLQDIHTAFNRHGIGRALWNYKEKDFGFVDDSFEEIRNEFIDIL